MRYVPNPPPAEWNTNSWGGDGQPVWIVTGGPICPDLLRLEQIGAADNLRGRMVRLFFRVLDRLMPVRQ